jgi:thiosulfate/3-mercaptopyruvate sulfurtransferase
MKAGFHTDALAETQWLAENIGRPDIRVIEVGSLFEPDSYAGGHIAGALHWPWQESLWHPLMRDFATPEDFARLMGQSGVGPETTVIFYSNLIQYAAYAFWVCTMRGHPRLKILNGNRSLWQNEGRPLTREAPATAPVRYPVRSADESSRIGREGVLAGLADPGRVLLDMRTPEEYRGERVSPPWFEADHGAVRKGYIPGARNIFYGDLLDPGERFKPAEILAQAFAGAGATPEKDIVSYCRLGHRGSMAWFILKKLLGYPRARVYDGSWTEWGSMVGMPIVNESLGV